jgi:hypothetical protein
VCLSITYHFNYYIIETNERERDVGLATHYERLKLEKANQKDTLVLGKNVTLNY